MKLLTVCFIACLLILSLQQTTSVGSGSTNIKLQGGLEGQNPLIFNSKPKPLPGKQPKPSQPVIPTTNPNPNPQKPIGSPPPTTTPPTKPPVNPVPPTTFLCPNDTVRYIDVKEIVKKRVYVPYYVYYSPHQYITGEAAIYLTSLITRVRELRTRLYSFRYLLKHLLQKKKISQALYQKTDKTVINKLLRIEHAIRQRKLTIKYVNEQLELVYNILKKLDYNINIPADCNVIQHKTGKPCKQGYIERLTKSTSTSRKFKKNRLFIDIYITKKFSRISNVVKVKDTIHFIKRGPVIIKIVKKLNPNLRKLIMDKAYAKVLKDNKVKLAIKVELSKLKASKSQKVKDAINNKSKRKLLIRKMLKKMFPKKLTKECKSMLRTPYVKQLRKVQFKDIVKTKRSEGKIEKGIVRVPSGLLKNASTKVLKEFVALKYKLGK